MEDLEERTAESSPPASTISFSGGDAVVRDEIFLRLKQSALGDATSDRGFRARLEAHFNRFSLRYLLDVFDRVEDVLLHQQILAECEDSNKRPVFHARYLKCISEFLEGEDDNDSESNDGLSISHSSTTKLTKRGKNVNVNCEESLGLHELTLKGKKVKHMENGSDTMEAISARKEIRNTFLHEIIFSSQDKPKLLAKLTSLLSELGLNIREAHVFSTIDGYCLDVFVVGGWPSEECEVLLQELRNKSRRKYACLTESSNSSPSREVTELHEKVRDIEINRELLNVGEKIASGSSGDLFYGTYLGNEVAVKVLKSEQLSSTLESEFVQEVMILRTVNHPNIIKFFGACTTPPEFSIVTEFMHGGSIFDFLHKRNNILKLPELLRIAIDVCKAMEYLHQKNIIHRDLKTANLLLDSNRNVKVADFGVARFQSINGDMTAETGTYRWMAPEVIKHQRYDEKADVFSFAIVLLELATSKIPYGPLTPLQVALGVREGMRPNIPDSVHPRLSQLIRKCWEADPSRRPTFTEIINELIEFSLELKDNVSATNCRNP